jgi:TolB-like protein/tetratricopeptide (TPR) repeat protein/tRNA A-37 threonylcarbamoyl transferase component Bud32
MTEEGARTGPASTPPSRSSQAIDLSQEGALGADLATCRRPSHETWAPVEHPGSGTARKVSRLRLPSPASLPADLEPDRKTNRVATSGSFVPGQPVAGRFRIVRLLARGGMGEVYEAEDLDLSERVALKAIRAEILDDEQSRERFKREVQLARKVTHPNVCRTFDSVRHVPDAGSDVVLVTMELLEGETLSERLKRGGALAPDEALPLVQQMAAALQAAHDAGVIHRDFKSANVMLERTGEGARAVVTDFGLARGAGVVGVDGKPSAKATSAFIGTPEYMAPEQVEGGAITPAADVYALGVVMYEMVTGRCPFSGTTPLEIMVKRLRERPRSPRLDAAGLDPRWEAVILRCLERDPKDRFASAADVAHALVGASVPAAAGSVARRRRRRVALAVAAVLTVLAIVGGTALRPTPRASSVSSLAVLPLANAGGDPGLDYLGEGIAEGVISRLSQHPRLKVMARGTAFGFKGRENEPVKVGQELKVDAVLTGRVVPQGDTASMELQLVEVKGGAVLWSERYIVRPSAATAVEGEIAARITDRLHLPSLVGGTPMDPEAHTFYLKGRYQLNKRTPEGLRQAHVLFGEALERDPDHPLLHAGLADAWTLIGAYTVLPPADSFPRAMAAARQALERDESLAEARTALALSLFLYEWKWDEAEAEFRRATEMRPGYATGHHWYGEYLIGRGRTAEALAALRRAKELDPLSLVITVDEGRALFFGHQFPEARAACKRALDVSPVFVPAIDCLAMVATEEERYDDAVAGYTEVSRLWGSDSGRPGRIMALARAGRRAEAETLWAQLIAGNRPGYTAQVTLALVQASLGRKDEAFRRLEAARVERSTNIAYLKTDPRVDSLRADPRWAEFAGRVGLE